MGIKQVDCPNVKGTLTYGLGSVLLDNACRTVMDKHHARYTLEENTYDSSDS
jgi:hypothetical protein